MTLHDSIISDVSAVFMQTDDFAETVVYSFRAGGSRTLPAIVERDPPAFYDSGGNVIMPEFSITIADNGTGGVKAAEVDTGGDSVELIAEHGDTSKTRLTVLKVTENDRNGTITLALK